MNNGMVTYFGENHGIGTLALPIPLYDIIYDRAALLRYLREEIFPQLAAATSF